MGRLPSNHIKLYFCSINLNIQQTLLFTCNKSNPTNTNVHLYEYQSLMKIQTKKLLKLEGGKLLHILVICGVNNLDLDCPIFGISPQKNHHFGALFLL